jgi:hypothetical protein
MSMHILAYFQREWKRLHDEFEHFLKHGKLPDSSPGASDHLVITDTAVPATPQQGPLGQVVWQPRRSQPDCRLNGSWCDRSELRRSQVSERRSVSRGRSELRSVPDFDQLPGGLRQALQDSHRQPFPQRFCRTALQVLASARRTRNPWPLRKLASRRRPCATVQVPRTGRHH